jgi:hypothetical protein
VLFPRLYHPQRSAWVLTNDEYCEWMDQLLLPALRQTQAPEAIVRLPRSGQEAILRGSAAATEGATASDHHLPRIQLLTHFLPPGSLAAIWGAIQEQVAPGIYYASEYGQARLLLTSKNLKGETRRRSWSEMVQAWNRDWDLAVDDQFLTSAFFDVGKEVCVPSGVRHEGQEPVPPEAFKLIWRRCCLSQFEEWLVRLDTSLDPVTPTDPVPTDPVPTDLVPTDPVPTDPVPTDPVPTDLVPTDPVPTDVLTSPAPTSLVSTSPALTSPAPTEAIPLTQTSTCSVPNLPKPVWS